MRFFGKESERMGHNPEEQINGLYQAELKITDSEVVEADIILLSAIVMNIRGGEYNPPTSNRSSGFPVRILSTAGELEAFGGVDRVGELRLDKIPVPDNENVKKFLFERKFTGGDIFATIGAKQYFESGVENNPDDE